jgi:hypothetical protein
VPHFSRSLREVGLFADTLPTLSQRSVEFSPSTDGNRGLTAPVPGFAPQCEVMSVTDEHWQGLGYRGLKSKAPHFDFALSKIPTSRAKNAREMGHPDLILMRSSILSQRSVEFSPPTRSSR